MKKIIFIFILSLLFVPDSHAQLIKKLGFKAGPVMFWQYTNNNSRNSFGYGFDFGLFAEINGYKKLSFIGELHFSDMGTAKGTAGITGPLPFGYSDNYIDINNRYQYLSVHSLLKYDFTGKGYGLYTITGFRLDMMVSNYYNGYHEIILKPSNNHFEFGGTLGLGLATKFGLLFELQYNPNFTPMFRYNLDNTDVKFYNASVNLLTGYQF